jgi:hypothetical protein
MDCWQVDFCDDAGGFLFNFRFSGVPTRQDAERIALENGVDPAWLQYMGDPMWAE